MILCIKSNVRLRVALIIVNKPFNRPPIFKNEITYIVYLTLIDSDRRRNQIGIFRMDHFEVFGAHRQIRKRKPSVFVSWYNPFFGSKSQRPRVPNATCKRKRQKFCICDSISLPIYNSAGNRTTTSKFNGHCRIIRCVYLLTPL